MMKKVVAYARVSTASESQADSLINQQDYFSREIERNPEYQFGGIYADRGTSGTKLNRPEFDRMLYDAGLDVIEVKNADADDRKNMKKYVTMPSTTRKPKMDLIYVKNSARFARNVLVEGILRDLAKVGVYVKFLDLNKSTENSEDIMYLQMFSVFAEGESRQKSTAVRFGQKQGAARGRLAINGLIYGYSYNQPENRLEIIESESLIIRKIFCWYAGGLGIRRIIGELNKAGHCTRAGKPFGKTSISRILDNEKYCGTLARLKWDTGMIFKDKRGNPKKRAKDEWVITASDKVPAIIDEAMFSQCQALRQGKLNYENQVGIYKGTTEYAGLIVCGACGAAYTANVDKGRRFYNCNSKKQHGTGACSGRNISETLLERLITPAVYYATKCRTLKFGRDLLTIMRDELVEQLASTPGSKIKMLQDQIEDIEAEAHQLTKMVMKRLVSDEEYARHKIPLDEQRAKLVVQLQALTMPKAEIEEQIAEADAALRKMDSIVIAEDTPREAILADIVKIKVCEPGQLEITFRQFYQTRKLKMHDISLMLEYE